MKMFIIPINIIRKVVLTLSLILLFTLSSNGQESKPQNPLLGGWTLDYSTTAKAAEGKGLARFSGMETATKQQVTTFYQGRQFVFLGNGTYLMKSTGRPQRGGSWTLANGILTLADTGNNQKLTYAAAFTNTHLVLRLEGNGAENALFRNLYLIPSL
ncbi:hypothetical protein [Flagellimonas sp. S3867]|uniref:hypothetical protein n=1 Tax=Flagellimonas sp. S3867 TaxID=2768063 RepID=UPI001685E035|nr:hypothetical protein [Flagellimonas sp. S3867]